MNAQGVEAENREPALRHWVARSFWLVPLAFYGATVSPTAGWVDAPFIARVVHRVELTVWVNHHNLFTIVGAAWLRILPGSFDPHFALNLLCAALAAATVFLVFRIGIRLTRNVWASALGASVLMVSHSLWWHATMLEVYTLSTALLSAIVLFVVRYDQARRLEDLAIAVFFFGLACSNHPQMGLVVVGFVGMLGSSEVRSQVLRPVRLLAIVACFLAGFSVYLSVFAIEFALRAGGSMNAKAAGDVLSRMLDETSGGTFRQYMFPSGIGMRRRLFWWGYWTVLLVYNFIPPWLFAAPVGLWNWWQRRELRISFTFVVLVLTAQVVWSINYMVWDMWAFSLPVYLLVGILLLVGIAALANHGRRTRGLVIALAPTIALAPFLYAHAAAWASRSDAVMQQLDRIPQLEQATAFWDPLDYFLDPNKQGYDRVERSATRILEELSRGASLWGNEATALYPLSFYYKDVLRLRTDVSYHLVFGMSRDDDAYRRHATSMIDHLERGRRVYVTSLAYPDRAVLERVYARLNPRRSLDELRRLSDRELAETFPSFVLSPVAFGEDTTLYELRRREPGSETGVP
jgi:hypothetical protein